MINEMKRFVDDDKRKQFFPHFYIFFWVILAFSFDFSLLHVSFIWYNKLIELPVLLFNV